MPWLPSAQASAIKPWFQHLQAGAMMKIRRFFAPDMRHAIRMVRQEQGADAVILSSRKVDGGIEIVSALDYDEALFDEMQAAAENPQAVPGNLDARTECPDPGSRTLAATGSANHDSGLKRTDQSVAHSQTTVGGRATSSRGDELLPELAPLPWTGNKARTEPNATATNGGSSQQRIEWAQDPALVAMQREIEGLRSLLQDQLASLAWNDLRAREPARAAVEERLIGLGLDRDLGRAVAAEIRLCEEAEVNWKQALARLAARLPVADEEELGGDGVIALVGPTGVGKTTTIAKLAARHVQRYGRHSVALVTTDAYRIGAFKQLQTFGQILGIQTHLAQTQQELDDILYGMDNKQRVFLDTAGMSQRDPRLSVEVANLSTIAGLSTLLVVAANVQQSTISETMRAYSDLPISGLVLTKLDEATSLGPLLSALALAPTQLPAVYLCAGQRVPEDLLPVRRQSLLDRALALSRPANIRSASVSERLSFNNPDRAGPQLPGYGHAYT